MDSPDPPQAPDPQVTAAAQGAANVESARVNASLNRPDQITPWGSQTWKDMGGDRWQSSVNVSPTAQKVIDAQIGTSDALNSSIQHSLGQVNQTIGQPMDFSAEGLKAAGDRVGDATYEQYTRRLDPTMAHDEEALKSRLINQGLMPGTEAYDHEQKMFGLNKNDAYDQARRSATLAGTAEQDRQISNQLRGRNQVINELSSLRSGAQIQSPQFSPGMSGASVAPAPYANSAYQSFGGQMQGYNADVGSNNSMMTGMAGLGAAAMMAPAGTFPAMAAGLAAF